MSLKDSEMKKNWRVASLYNYIICENFGRYYKLESEKSPEDFDDNCECGGHLQYVASLEDH